MRMANQLETASRAASACHNRCLMLIADINQRGAERHNSALKVKGLLDRIITVPGRLAVACAERQIKEANSREPAGDRTPLRCQRATHSGMDFLTVGRLSINNNLERPPAIPGNITLYLATRGNSRTASLHHWTRGLVEKATL